MALAVFLDLGEKAAQGVGGDIFFAGYFFLKFPQPIWFLRVVHNVSFCLVSRHCGRKEGN